MTVLFTHKQLSEAGGPTLMQGPSTIIKSSLVALMLYSVDGPLSPLPIHKHLGKEAELNPFAVLSKQHLNQGAGDWGRADCVAVSGTEVLSFSFNKTGTSGQCKRVFECENMEITRTNQMLSKATQKQCPQICRLVIKRWVVVGNSGYETLVLSLLEKPDLVSSMNISSEASYHVLWVPSHLFWPWLREGLGTESSFITSIRGGDQWPEWPCPEKSIPSWAAALSRAVRGIWTQVKWESVCVRECFWKKYTSACSCICAYTS